MRYALLGCGRIGIATGLALASRPDTLRLTLLDREPHRAHGLAARLSGSRAELRACVIDAADTPAMLRALEGADAIAVAAPWRATRQAIRAATPLDLPLAGVARPRSRPALPPSHRASPALPPALLACGLQPGLTEILASAVAATLPGASRLDIRCGCIPTAPGAQPSPPAVGAGGSSALSIRDGMMRAVRRFSEEEPLHIEGLGPLEASHDGMLPWLAEDPRLTAIGEVTHKTIALPGFAAAARALQEGAPAEVFEDDADTLAGPGPGSAPGPAPAPAPGLGPAPAPGPGPAPGSGPAPAPGPGLGPGAGEDVTVLQVEAFREESGEWARLSLLERSDPGSGLGSLARTAGFTLACATAMLAEGSIDGHGWLQPERVLTGPALELLLAELALLGVSVHQSRSPG